MRSEREARQERSRRSVAPPSISPLSPSKLTRRARPTFGAQLIEMLGFIDDRALDFSKETGYRDALFLGDCDTAARQLAADLDALPPGYPFDPDVPPEMPPPSWVEALERRIAQQPPPPARKPAATIASSAAPSASSSSAASAAGLPPAPPPAPLLLGDESEGKGMVMGWENPAAQHGAISEWTARAEEAEGEMEDRPLAATEVDTAGGPVAASAGGELSGGRAEDGERRIKKPRVDDEHDD